MLNMYKLQEAFETRSFALNSELGYLIRRTHDNILVETDYSQA